jgi:hypothetical protein
MITHTPKYLWLELWLLVVLEFWQKATVPFETLKQNILVYYFKVLLLSQYWEWPNNGLNM